METSSVSTARNSHEMQPPHLSATRAHERIAASSSRTISRGDHQNLRHRSDTRECTDWLKETLASYSAKEIAHRAGCSLRAAENAKRGDNGMSMANIITFMRNDAAFRAMFYAYGGGDGPETDPEFVVAMNMAMNAYARRRGIQD